MFTVIGNEYGKVEWRIEFRSKVNAHILIYIQHISDTMSMSPAHNGNTTHVEYVSICDQPKRGMGIPKTCTLPYEDKQDRNREHATR